ncbi:hypothetical protein ES332_A11G273700v1 [Gossypium tomentosum]|uniref:Cystatin domain-containing protein n=1 Tax=Gossypium tomentosum TaxID=34277 RepID=A0A5D2NFB8_GOSTO|nr:hypothetical protein ES332_A11G273700v1 [Gossypium tomentosum]
MAKVTLHFVIVIIGLLFNHTCEKASPVPKDKSIISNFDLFSRQIQDNVFRGRTYLVDVRQRTCDQRTTVDLKVKMVGASRDRLVSVDFLAIN